MKERFGGIERLFGVSQLTQLQNSHVAIVGVGGVGCWSAEMLARAGVGQITLIDADEICVTNINRQIHALDSTVGQSKVQVMAKRIHDINPACQVNCHEAFFMAKNSDELLIQYDFLIDAIDSVNHKVLLLVECRRRKIPVVTCGGVGGKTDLSRIKTADLTKTRGDTLLRKVRKEMRNNYGMKKTKKFKVHAVFLDQEMVLPVRNHEQATSHKLDCDSGYGTSPMTISSIGIRAANLVIEKLIGK